MRHRTAKNYVLFLILSLGVMPAFAGHMEFRFTYDFVPGDRISGTLFGDLQADNDTIIVTDFSAYHGPVGIFNPFLTIFGPTFVPQTASLSGAVVDLWGTGENAYVPGLEVLFSINSALGFAGMGTEFGDTIEEEVFDPGHWSITQVNATVPGPPTTFILLLGLFVLRMNRKRAI